MKPGAQPVEQAVPLGVDDQQFQGAALAGVEVTAEVQAALIDARRACAARNSSSKALAECETGTEQAKHPAAATKVVAYNEC